MPEWISTVFGVHVMAEASYCVLDGVQDLDLATERDIAGGGILHVENCWL